MAAAALRDLGTPSAVLHATLLGQAAVGHQLEAFSGLWVGSGTEITYRWEGCPLGGLRRDRRSDKLEVRAHDERRREPGSGDPRGGVHRDEHIGTDSRCRGQAAYRRTAIDQGLPRVGARLVANPGRWTGDDVVFTFSWRRCRTRCVNAGTDPTYRVQPGDRGARFRLGVQGSNWVGTSLAVSALTARVR
jgi:hypothetical protein